jgi:outer membrane protein with beta-barrel domain
MTRNSRLVASTLAALVLVGASDPAAAQFTLGARVAFTSSDVSSDPAPINDVTRHNSFGGGAFLRIGNGALSLQPEVLMMTKGVEALNTGSGSRDLSIDYVEVPLLLRYRAFGGPYAPYLMVGPSLGYDLKCEVTNGATGPDGADCDDQGIERAKLDIGAAAAVGLEFKFGFAALLLEGRYTHGFTDILDPDADTVKNRSFAGFVGFAVPLGGARQ